MNKIKIPKGTIIKVDNSTVRLTKSLYAVSNGKTILLEEEIINTDLMTIKGTDMKSIATPIIDQTGTALPNTIPSNDIISPVLESVPSRDNLIDAATAIATNPCQETNLLIKKAVKYLHLEFDEAILRIAPEQLNVPSPDKKDKVKPIIKKDANKTK